MLKTIISTLTVAVFGAVVVASPALAAPTLSLDLNGSNVTAIAAGNEIAVKSSAAIPGLGESSHAVGLSWSKESLQLLNTSSIVQPEGWELQYTTDGVTWSTTAPGDLSTVVAVRSVGDLNAKGVNTFQTTAVSTLIETQSNFQGSSGGDGYDLTFTNDRVFNVFHHNASQIQLDCHLKATGASCYGAVKNFPGYATSNTSSSFWHAATSKLYVMSKRTSDATFGFACIDFANMANPVLCSTPFYSLDDGSASTNSLHGATRSGDIVYLLDSSDYNLLCLNLATATACADNQTTLPTGSAIASTVGRISSSGTKIWYNTYDRFGCWDTATDANCGGNVPQTIAVANQHPPFPVRNSSGTLLGFCTYRTATCVDATNTLFTMPAGLSAFVTGTTLPVWNYDGAGQWAEADNRLYLNKGPSASATSDVYCHDFDTDAACAGFAGTGVGTRIYAILKDPSIANCMWTNGDAGQITTFDGTTGTPGCTSSVPTVEMPYSAVVPRMSCQENGRVVRWDRITFHAPSGIPVADLRVTMKDTNGDPITGWTNRSLTSEGVLDMTGLTVDQTGTRPTIKVEAGSVSGTLLDDLTADVKFKADAPELCLTLKVQANCPNFTPAQGDLSVPDGMIQATAVTTPTVGSPYGNDTQVTIPGTNTGTVCEPTINLLSTPNSDETTLANTGSDSGSMAFIAMALLSLGAYLRLLSRGRVLGRN
jgi:hypothetical protein